MYSLHYDFVFNHCIVYICSMQSYPSPLFIFHMQLSYLIRAHCDNLDATPRDLRERKWSICFGERNVAYYFTKRSDSSHLLQIKDHIDSWVQGRRNSIANALGLLQSCNKPLICHRNLPWKSIFCHPVYDRNTFTHAINVRAFDDLAKQGVTTSAIMKLPFYVPEYSTSNTKSGNFLCFWLSAVSMYVRFENILNKWRVRPV